MSYPTDADITSSADKATVRQLCGIPMDTGRFLLLACSIAESLDRFHSEHGIHRHLSPRTILLETEAGGAHCDNILPLRASDNAGAVFAEMLPYISPEQTGRMNRQVDRRSDLYSLGALFYELLVGTPPFQAGDALEWAHCHIARQARPPEECGYGIPVMLSRIVMRLLAKSPDERYQTAAGLHSDLLRCRADWQSAGAINLFTFAENDISDQLLIPQRLYGRERDGKILLQLLERTCAGEGPLLLMVKGYSGIGKSALIRELYGPALNAGGRFLSGKFDQYKRDIPYATIAEAFLEPVIQILSESPEILEKWRFGMLEALGINGQLIIEMIPEIELIIGPQQPVQELLPADALLRFNTVFQRFVGLFTDQRQPLVLFLDDLQWVDPASLRLMEFLATSHDLPALLIIGAYRENEVDPAHPLMLALERIHRNGASLSLIELAPLSIDDLGRFLADIIAADRMELAPLTWLVLEKTGGNPFFVIQFLLTLHEDGLLRFDRQTKRWIWDTDGIIAKEYTDNVVALMASRLAKLTEATQQVLQYAACVGNRFDRETVTLVSARSKEAVHRALTEALQNGIVQHISADSYCFLHDRIQQASYSLLPQDDLCALHLKIGRLLLGQITSGDAGEHVFDIVNQLNLGSALIDDVTERFRVAQLNLIAGRRAKSSTAYGSACTYLSAGVSLCGTTSWSMEPELIFSLHRELAEAEYLNGNYARSQELLLELVKRTDEKLEKARLYNFLIIQYTLTARYPDAISAGREALLLLDVHFPAENLKDELDAAISRYRELLGKRVIASLAEETEMTDPAMRVALELLSNMVVPARYTDSTLFALVSIINVNISLQYGPTAKSTVGYTAFGMVLNAVMNAFRDAYEFGLVGLRLSERFNAMPQKCQTSFMIGHYLNQWVKHLKWADEVLEDGIRQGLASGEVQWTGYSMAYKPFQPFYRGERLELVLKEIPTLLYFTRKTKNQWASDTLTGMQFALEELCDQTSAGSISTLPERNEFLSACREGRSFGALGRYAVLQAQIHYLFGRLDEAKQAVAMAQEYAGFFSSSISVAALNVYHSLILLALCDDLPEEKRSELLTVVAQNQKQMQIWVASCPDNFRHLHLLVEAESARVAGDVLTAERLYEQSIQWSHENGFIQDEALAHERAALFYRHRELFTNADGHVRNARMCYARWGAVAKVRELERRYPWLSGESSHHAGLDSAGVGSPDVIAVIKATQAISGEIKLDSLLDTLMTIVLENAGAQRGVLLLERDARMQVVAEALAGRDGVYVQGFEGVSPEGSLPLTVINLVGRTREKIITDDAHRQALFSSDPYFKKNEVLSMLCLPLLRQTELIGMLYLENDLVRGAFSTDKIALLEVLAAQAAISLENALLYLDQKRTETAVRESERRYRSIIENFQDVYYCADADGCLTMVSPSGVKLLGYTTAEEMLGCLIRETLYNDPTERDAFINNLKMKGQLNNYEVTLKRKDGTPVPVTTSAHLVFDASGAYAGVEGTFRDVTEAKAAEAEKISLEKQLLHAQKLESLGVLAGGIAHDFNNILLAIMGNADLALMRINRESPAVENLHRIEKAAARAADLAKQMLAYSGKGKFVIENIDINTLLAEMLHMLEVSISKHAVLRLNPYHQLPSVEADATQMRQIIMNLVINASEAIGDKSGVIAITTGCMDCDRGYLKDVWLDENIIEGLYVYLEIADTGCGMDKDTLSKLFDPFFTTKFTGRGLGMAAVLGIVRGHKGAIKVYSEPHRGTTFKILIPASGKPVEIVNGHSKHEHWQGSGTVLLVDDEETVRGIGREMLQELGFTVITADDGREAVAAFKQNPDIAFVILDLTMPHMDGEQCFRELKQIKPDIKVIISSGYNEQEVTQKFIGKGLAGFIQKPYKVSTLREAIQKM